MSMNSTQSARRSSLSIDTREQFKVVIRIRPPLEREVDPSYGFHSITRVSNDDKQVTIQEYLGAELYSNLRHADMLQHPELVFNHKFTFDTIYGEESKQSQVYETTAKNSVWSVLEGYNATIIAYGQTGTGKTYTMEGFKFNSTDTQRGIVPRANDEIFHFIENSRNANTKFMVRASYLQIYNEQITDLLKLDRGYLQIREEKRRGVFVEGLSEWAVRSPSEIYSLIQKGQQTRATASTRMNDISSRSHAVFIMIVEQMTTLQFEDGTESKNMKIGKLNLVDLAGSERVRVTGATGKCLEEAKKINQSLSALGNVIAALTDMKPRSHVPYRDSKLTRLLEDSLGGNCKTTMMAMVSPAYESFLESLSTLKFAHRAKKIRNDPHINEDVDEKGLLRKYEIELRRLRDELEKRSENVTDMRRVMELEDEKKQAELDKEAAMQALEERSKEFLNEKEEKKKLEEKIKKMNSQLLIGGKKIEDLPQFRTALEERQKAIRQEYEERLQDIEADRQKIEEDKAQIDRYKQLLLRQRDIMVALTSRVNERDEIILRLQDELDSYDRFNQETEQALQSKSSRCEYLESILKRNNIEIEPDVIPQFIYNAKSVKHYPPFHTDSILLDDKEPIPLQMLTAEEKIVELQQIIEQKIQELVFAKQPLPRLSPPKEDPINRTTELLNRLKEIQKQVVDGKYVFE